MACCQDSVGHPIRGQIHSDRLINHHWLTHEIPDRSSEIVSVHTGVLNPLSSMKMSVRTHRLLLLIRGLCTCFQYLMACSSPSSARLMRRCQIHPSCCRMRQTWASW